MQIKYLNLRLKKCRDVPKKNVETCHGASLQYKLYVIIQINR